MIGRHRYLNFRATALSGNAFHDDDPRFAVLSHGLRQKIKICMNRPVLTRVRASSRLAADGTNTLPAAVVSVFGCCRWSITIETTAITVCFSSTSEAYFIYQEQKQKLLMSSWEVF
eukprot:COSAG05_NODE_3442_length_2060_cov_5.664196_3_plen_116_part_00